MHSRVEELRCREVINVCNGHRMGYVEDVVVDILDGKVLALVIPGECRWLGMLARGDDYIIPWEKIKRIGDDIILVEVSGEYKREKHKRRLWC